MSGNDSTAQATEAAETATNTGKDGVIASAYSVRDSAGRFLPGNPGGPGRGSKQYETAVIEAIRHRIHPEAIAEGIDWLVNNRDSWRSVNAGIELYMKYMLGPAPARSPERENVIDVILAKMRENAG